MRIAPLAVVFPTLLMATASYAAPSVRVSCTIEESPWAPAVEIPAVTVPYPGHVHLVQGRENPNDMQGQGDYSVDIDGEFSPSPDGRIVFKGKAICVQQPGNAANGTPSPTYRRGQVWLSNDNVSFTKEEVRTIPTFPKSQSDGVIIRFEYIP
ncbi:hypothetical protein [Nitrospirillum amazonense]|uniref:hypothetical protein n=1 Tax=Nitrospirillum amazonense TaxID=28077 RepID=UPI0011A7A3E6|nr:hypothetical protein [Nitrospirillum amazonense]